MHKCYWLLTLRFFPYNTVPKIVALALCDPDIDAPLVEPLLAVHRCYATLFDLVKQKKYFSLDINLHVLIFDET